MKVLSIMAVLAVLVSATYAALPVNATATAGTPLTLSNSVAAGTVSAWGGNVTPVNLVINSSTLHWQGFFGNVTGSLGLGYGSSVLKTWSLSTVRGQVYASQGTSIDFTVLNSTSVTLANVDAAFSFLTGASDSAANSGSNGANSAFNITHYTVQASSKPRILTYNSSGASVWETVVLNSGDTANTTKYVFAGLLNNSGIAADGTAANFQILVPENSAGNLVSTTYYFYGEVQ